MSIKPDHDYNFHTKDGRATGSKGESIAMVLSEEDKRKDSKEEGGDRAIAQFSEGSLRATTNQFGTQGYQFQLDPQSKAISSTFAYPDTLRTTKHAVQDFFVYDGAHPGITDRGKIATSRDQILPDVRIKEQDAIEWNRVGSKKGWMFEGRPQIAVGGTGENKATHTNDGFIESIKKHKWQPLDRSADKQGLATREMPAIDIENNARGIGTAGEGSGSGGMAGGYREVNKRRLARLPIPMAKYNWTGTRVVGTGREDQSLAAGAGGFRAGYASQYPDRPSFPLRRTTGLSRVTQNAA
jgi:hypothetical protein